MIDLVGTTPVDVSKVGPPSYNCVFSSAEYGFNTLPLSGPPVWLLNTLTATFCCSLNGFRKTWYGLAKAAGNPSRLISQVSQEFYYTILLMNLRLCDLYNTHPQANNPEPAAFFSQTWLIICYVQLRVLRALCAYSSC